MFAQPGVRWVILEATYLLSIDTSGQSALETLGRELARRDIGWIVCGLHRQPQQQLDPVTTAHWPAPPVLSPDLPAALRRTEAPTPA